MLLYSNLRRSGHPHATAVPSDMKYEPSPLAGSKIYRTADVKLLFECFGREKTHFCKLSLVVPSSLRPATQSGAEKTRKFLSPHVISVSSSLWRRANAKWWGIRPEVMGTFFNRDQETSRVTHPEMRWNRGKHMQPLFHKSISSTQAAAHRRWTQGLLLWTDVSIRAQLTGANTRKHLEPPTTPRNAAE